MTENTYGIKRTEDANVSNNIEVDNFTNMAKRCYENLGISAPEYHWCVGDSGDKLLFFKGDSRFKKYRAAAKKMHSTGNYNNSPSTFSLQTLNASEYLGFVERYNLLACINLRPYTLDTMMFVPPVDVYENKGMYERTQDPSFISYGHFDFMSELSSSGFVAWWGNQSGSNVNLHYNAMRDTFDNKQLSLVESVEKGNIEWNGVLIGNSTFMPAIVHDNPLDALSEVYKLSINNCEINLLVTRGIFLLFPIEKGASKVTRYLEQHNPDWYWQPTAEFLGFILKPNFLNFTDPGKLSLENGAPLKNSELIYDFWEANKKKIESGYNYSARD